MQRRPTFSTRQKEQARREKQRAKFERKQQRKAEKALSGSPEPMNPEPPAEPVEREADDVSERSQ